MFDTLPAWAKIVLIVGVVLIGLVVLAPIIKFLVDLVIGVSIGLAVLGGGYLLLKKFS